jgi:hypothetical protein
MKSELEAVDHFVMNEITPSLFAKTISAEKCQERIQFIDAERQRVCNAILSEVYELSLSQRAEAYIQFHQAALQTLMDTLRRYTFSVTNTALIEFYKEVFCMLEQIVSYIQEYLNKFMDHDLPIPQSYGELLKKNLTKSCKLVEVGFRGSNVPPELLDISLRPVKGFLDKDKMQDKISFRRAIYLQELVKDLLELVEAKVDDKNTRFHELLFRLNFNAPDYIYYCTAALDWKLNKMESQPAKLEMLDRYIKIIRRQPIKSNYSLVPNFQPVWEQMLIWIKEEYQYLLAHNTADVKVSPKITGMKIRTTFSVPQLAAFARTMIEKGAITNDTNIEVLRFFAHYVTTINSEDISEESLKNKFYNIEPGTKGQMREWFTGFLQVLDEL